jgi:hypothetical protein
MIVEDVPIKKRWAEGEFRSTRLSNFLPQNFN